MKKIISILLSLIMILSMTTAFADTIPPAPNGGGSGGGSGGGGGGFVSGGITTPVQVPKVEYTVSGTIYLPAEMVAPEGGLKVYGGFGGVNLDEVATASLSSTEEYVEEESEIFYEDYDVIAVIPEGKNYATYNTTCLISSSCEGFYGKFWIYDNYSNKGMTLSNKHTLSNMIQIEADKYEYSNVNCMFNTATTTASYLIECDDELKDEDIETDVYIIADDGYNKYTSRAEYISGSSVTGVLNLEVDKTYTLYYYIPSSSEQGLQKLDKGLFNIGTLNIRNNNEIILKSQLYISGTISLPDGFALEEDLDIILTTNKGISEVTIPKNKTSVEFIVSAFEDDWGDFVYIGIQNDERLMSGYLTPENEIIYDSVDYYIHSETPQPIENVDIVLEEQYIITGTIYLPNDIEMEEHTYFRVYVEIENTLTGYGDTQTKIISSTKPNANYTFRIKKSDCVGINNGGWTISYDLGTAKSISLPTSASNPLKTYIKPSASGGGGGGGNSAGKPIQGGTSSSGTSINGVMHTFEIPDNLITDYRFYLKDNSLTYSLSSAEEYRFANGEINKSFTLLSDSTPLKGLINGYFANYSNKSVSEPIVIQLYSSDNAILKTVELAEANYGYEFTDLNIGTYKIGVKIGDKQYYYANKNLVTNISDAETISLTETLFNTHNDIFYDNIYETNVKLYFDEVIINGELCKYENIKIYDKYGTLLNTIAPTKTISVGVTPFYLGIGDYYVSAFSKGSPYIITQLTTDISDAYRFDSEYRDTISSSFYDLADNTFIVDAMVSDVNDTTPTTNWLDEGIYKEPVLINDTFEVRTPEELAWISYKVMTGSSFENKKVKLINDIDISAHQWTPIGGWDGSDVDDTKVFRGVFDGQEHTISGLTIGRKSEKSIYDYCGLFGYIEYAKISNVKLSNVKIYSNGYHTGGLVGHSMSDDIIDCVDVDGFIWGRGHTGGIAGTMSATLTNSTVNVVIDGSSDNRKGGILGYGYGSILNCYAKAHILTDITSQAGIVSLLYGTMANCCSDVTFTSKNYREPITNGADIIKNCYYKVDNNTTNAQNGIIGLIESDFYGDVLLNEMNNNLSPGWYEWKCENNVLSIGRTNDKFWVSNGAVPYQKDSIIYISNENELTYIAEQVNNGETYKNKTVKILNDLDFGGKQWIPINSNSNTYFRGIFDGNYKKISNISVGNANYTPTYSGFFGIVSSTTIKNVVLDNCVVYGNNYAGTLVGAANGTEISNCISNGRVYGIEGYSSTIGGLIGKGYYSPINNSFFEGTVISNNGTAGGLVGYYYDCFETVSNLGASGTVKSTKYAGGLIGRTEYVSGFENCYADCDVTASSYVGGFIGYSENSDDDTVLTENCYYNIDRLQTEDGFNLSSSNKKAIGNIDGFVSSLTTQELSVENNFDKWDFNNIWIIDENKPVIRYGSTKPLTTTTYYISGSTFVLSSLIDTQETEYEVIVAAYDEDNRLLDLKTPEYNNITSAYETEIYGENVRIIKIMVWDSLSRLKPLGAVEVIKIHPSEIYNSILKNISNVYVEDGNATLYREGQTIMIDCAPVVIDETFYAPLRAIGEALDWIVEWNNSSQTMTLINNNHRCEVKVGSTIADYSYNDGEIEKICLSAAPILSNGRVLLPFGEIATKFGYTTIISDDKSSIAVLDSIGVKVKDAYENTSLIPSKIKLENNFEDLTRSEMASVIVSLYETITNTEIIPSSSISYSDTDDIDIIKASTINVIKGYGDGVFRPDGVLTNEQAIVVLCRTIKEINPDIGYKYDEVEDFEDVDISAWAYNEIMESKKLGILDGVFFETVSPAYSVETNTVIAIMKNCYDLLNNN